MRTPALLFTLLLAAVPLAALPADAAGAKKPPAAAVTADLDVDAIATRVQAVYDKTRTYRASFKQRYTVAAYKKTKDSSGSVVFEKPGKMSFRYANGNRVVADGKLIKVYERDNKQMYEQPMEKSQYPAALAFLVGDGDLRQTFELRKLDPKKMKFEGGWVLEATPKEATPAYQKMILYIDAKTAQVRRVLLLDAQGNKNRFDFQKPVVNKAPPKGEFAFTAPPGTQVIKP